jgi:hypothetical protein
MGFQQQMEIVMRQENGAALPVSVHDEKTKFGVFFITVSFQVSVCSIPRLQDVTNVPTMKK